MCKVPPENHRRTGLLLFPLFLLSSTFFMLIFLFGFADREQFLPVCSYLQAVSQKHHRQRRRQYQKGTILFVSFCSFIILTP